MLLTQYLKEFNNQASTSKFLAFKDVLGLVNKLKLIRQHSFENVETLEFTEFISNLYHVLCQKSVDIQSELLENCLDILIMCFKSNNKKITSVDYSNFFHLLIGCLREDYEDDQKLIKLLTVIRGLLNQNLFDEHNLRMIVDNLRDLTENHDNKDVRNLCIEILANLCLGHPAAKHLITRAIKTTKLRDKIKTPNDLVTFKYFMMMEDEIFLKDFLFFLSIALKDMRSGVDDFNNDAIRHSLDILTHLKRLEVKLKPNIAGEEKLPKLIENLIVDLVHTIPNTEPDLLAKQKFFDGIFSFLTEILQLDIHVIKLIEDFTEAVFNTAHLSRSASALEYYSMYVTCGGQKATSEIVIEGLLEFFCEENILAQDCEQVCEFILDVGLCLTFFFRASRSFA